MNMGGIIAGAIGGGAQAAQGMAQQQLQDESKLNLAQKFSDIDEMRQQRVAESNAKLERQGYKNKLQDTEDFTQSNFSNQLERTKQTKQADADIDLETSKKKLAIETDEVKKRGGDKSYLDALRGIASANRIPESSLSNAQAALARFELENKQEMLAARKLMSSDDPVKQEEGKKKLAALTYATNRSDSDIVGGAKVYEGLAKAAMSELESPDYLMMKDGPEKEARKAEIMGRTKMYNQNAAALLGGMADRRGAGGLIDSNKQTAPGDDPLGLRPKPKGPAAIEAASSAPAAGAATMPQIPGASATSLPAATPEGKALDEARARVATLEKQLQGYGSRQRAADPQGFERVQQQFKAAQQGLSSAQTNWNGAQPQMPPAFRYPSP